MKEWFSAQELADLKLPALPTAKKEHFSICRP